MEDSENKAAMDAMQVFNAACAVKDWPKALEAWRIVFAYFESILSPESRSLHVYRQILRGLEAEAEGNENSR